MKGVVGEGIQEMSSSLRPQASGLPPPQPGLGAHPTGAGAVYLPYVTRVPPVRDLRTTRTRPAYHRYAAPSQLGSAVGSTWVGRRANLTRQRTQLGCDAQPGRAGFIGRFARDITERKRAERQLQQAKEAAVSASESLAETVEELETFSQLAVGRELRMIELKQEVNELLVARGGAPKFEIVAEEMTA